MPNLSAAPDWPQSSTSTVNDSSVVVVVVPVDRMTVAVPRSVACVFGPQVPITMNRSLKDVAFMRTPADLSLYSRFPVAGQHFTTKPKVACALGSARLGIRAGTDRRSPMGE